MACVTSNIADAYDLNSMPDHVSDNFENETLSPDNAQFVHTLVIRMLQFMDALIGHPLYPYQRRLAYRILESLVWQNPDGTVGDGETVTALMSRQCLDGDTVVFRRNGTATRLRDHEDAWSTGVKPTKRYVIYGGGEIIATDNHPVMTPQGWTAAGLLRAGDLVSTMSAWTGVDGKVVPEAGFPAFLGFFITDGSFRPGQSPKFTNTNRAYLDEVAQLAKKLFDIDSKWYAKGKGYDLLFTAPRKKNNLTQGMRNLKWDHEFPLDVFEWDRESVGEFVNRAWSGDGTVRVKITRKKNTSSDVFLACGNDEVYARYWQALLLRHGVRSTVKREMMPRGTGVFHRLVIGQGSVRAFFDLVGEVRGKEEGSRRALKACAPLPPIAVETWPCTLSKHLYRGNDVCVRCSSPNPRTPSGVGKGSVANTPKTSQGLDGETLTFSRVMRIEDSGDREVFDVTYEGKGWFIAQGVQVHNSGKTETVADCVAVSMIILPLLAKRYPTRLSKYKEGLWVGCFAPVADQSETLFGRIVSRLTSERATEILGENDIGDKPVAGGKILKLSRSGSFVRMQTAHRRANIESKTYHLIVIDEAQNCDSFVVSKCVAAGTLVWTPGGPLPVENVVSERLAVISHDARWYAQKGVEAKVTVQQPSEWHANGEKPVWRVTTVSGRTIEATAEHRWIVRQRKGNRRPQVLTTHALRAGDTLPVALDATYGVRGTRDDGYVMGQILGDGCTSGGQIQWCGHLNGALAEMERIAIAWGDRWSVYKRHASGLIEGAFVGGNLKKFFKDEGVLGLKSTGKALQHQDYGPAFWSGAVAGLLDSDGCVSTSGDRSVTLALISERLIRQVQDGLLSLGVVSQVYSRAQTGSYGATSHTLWVLRIKGRDALTRLREVISLHDEGKNARLSELVEMRAGTVSRRATADTRRGYPKTVVWDRVQSVEYVGVRETYCVTVDQSNTVIWNGIVGLNSIYPMGASTNATFIKTGTPNTTRGDFYDNIRLNLRNETRRGARQNHYQADYHEVCKYNLNYKRYIENEKRRIGEDSDEFQLAYSLKWLLERGMLTTQAVLDGLGDKSMKTYSSWTKTPVLIGIDPARRQDSTVVTAVWVNWDYSDEDGYFEHRIINWLEMHGEDWEDQFGHIVDFCSHYNVLRVVIDRQGMGDLVEDRLKRLLPHCEVIGYDSTNPEQSKRWKHLITLIDKRLISWPAHAETKRTRVWKRFRQQMEEAEKTYKGPHIVVAAPNETDAHDDYVDSLALACYGSKDATMPTIEVSESPFFK